MRIGLVLNILDEQYQISVYKGIKKRAKELGVELLCLQQENTGFGVNTFTAEFPEKKFFDVDGVVILTSVIIDTNRLYRIEDIKNVWGDLPVVSVGQKIAGVPSLLINTDDSMRQLAEHLIIDHNYRNFIFISGSQNHYDAKVREQMFIKTVNEYKNTYPDLTYTVKRGWFTERAAIQVMKDYYEENPGKNPDAIVCANDNMAIGVYKYYKMNRNNPEIKQCAITGFDDIPQGRFEIPSLTTIRQPLDEIGAEAVDAIVSMIQGKKVEKDIFIDSKVILRNSCGCKHSVNKNSPTGTYVEQMQVNYIQSEQLLRMVSHIGQELNSGENESGIKYIINVNLEQLDIQDFCVLSFSEHSSDATVAASSMCRPIYVRRNGRYFYEFDGNRNMSLGEFYKKYLEYDDERPKSLALKFLHSGNEIIGCVFYDSNEAILPYLCTISINIAQSLNRIIVSAERKKRSEYLEKEVEERTRELVEANNRRMEVEAEVLRISEIERQRFSNDLHDDICQRLAGISMLCRSYSNQESNIKKEQMVELAELISDTLQTTRQYAHNSYPVELESLGMNHSISNLCNSFENQSGIHCEYEWDVHDDSIFDKIQKLNIFRIIQEALHNVMKHSKATEVKVSVKKIKSKIVVKIVDNGCGVSNKDSDKNKGLGINSMQYRANQIGATFKIKANKPKGTCVEVQLMGRTKNEK